MAKPVAVQPPLPNPTGNITNLNLSTFDQDLVRALTSYLGGVALRLNATITNDGSEPMKADLSMGGYSIMSVNNITGTGTATFATGEFASLEADTLVVNTSATVPTPDPSDDSTAVATTEWVNDAIAAIDTSTFVTLTGAQTITDKTLTEPIVTLEQGSAPSATDSGRIQWDTDDNALVVGNGTDTVVFSGRRERIWTRRFTGSSSEVFNDWDEWGMPVSIDITIRVNNLSSSGTVQVHLSSDNGVTWVTTTSYRAIVLYATTSPASSSLSGQTYAPIIAFNNTIQGSHPYGATFSGTLTGFAVNYMTISGSVAWYATGNSLAIGTETAHATVYANALRISSTVTFDGEVTIKAYYE